MLERDSLKHVLLFEVKYVMDQAMCTLPRMYQVGNNISSLPSFSISFMDLTDMPFEQHAQGGAGVGTGLSTKKGYVQRKGMSHPSHENHISVFVLSVSLNL